jgi:Na+/H+ antiporter NhaD/arsenite permease-like protein
VFEFLGILLFMAVVIGVAALLLTLWNLTLRGNPSLEEREAAVATRTHRWQSRWHKVLFVLALIALPAHAFGWVEAPLGLRVLWFGLAAWVALTFIRRPPRSPQN